MGLRKKMMIIAAVLCLFGAGCGGEDQIYLEQAVAETADCQGQRPPGKAMCLGRSSRQGMFP